MVRGSSSVLEFEVFKKRSCIVKEKAILDLDCHYNLYFLTQTPFAKAILHLVTLEISNKSGKILNLAAYCLGILIIK